MYAKTINFGSDSHDISIYNTKQTVNVPFMSKTSQHASERKYI